MCALAAGCGGICRNTSALAAEVYVKYHVCRSDTFVYVTKEKTDVCVRSGGGIRERVARGDDVISTRPVDFCRLDCYSGFFFIHVCMCICLVTVI